jgi:hypothetical protein
VHFLELFYLLCETGNVNQIMVDHQSTRFDGFVKSPHAALRRILRHCSAPQVRFIPCGFARLACEHLTKPSENRLL